MLNKAAIEMEIKLLKESAGSQKHALFLVTLGDALAGPTNLFL